MYNVRTFQNRNKRKSYTIKTLQAEFPKINKSSTAKLNRNIFQCLKVFVNDKNTLIASLIQNPFKRSTDYKSIKKTYGSGVVRSMQMLNRLYDCDQSLINRQHSISPEVTLFLVNFRFMFRCKDEYPQQTRNMLTKRRVAYALKHLNCCFAYELHQELEDEFFRFLKPEIYQHYGYFLKFAKKTLIKREKEVRSLLERSFKKSRLTVETQSRVKTVNSIYRKMNKRNILYSQVLDTVGLRLIVGRKSDCYRVMEHVLRQSTVMPSKIKDYIAVPKPNGYQSIHLVIMFNRYPVEIQIRTKEMNARAQFGAASHIRYKKLF